MSLKIAVKSVDDKGERIMVHSSHHDVEQLNYQPTEGSFDEDVEQMTVNEFTSR